MEYKNFEYEKINVNDSLIFTVYFYHKLLKDVNLHTMFLFQIGKILFFLDVNNRTLR